MTTVEYVTGTQQRVVLLKKAAIPHHASLAYLRVAFKFGSLDFEISLIGSGSLPDGGFSCPNKKLSVLGACPLFVSNMQSECLVFVL